MIESSTGLQMEWQRIAVELVVPVAVAYVLARFAVQLTRLAMTRARKGNSASHSMGPT